MCCEHLLNGEVPYKVINTDTQEAQEYNYLGHWDDRQRPHAEFGFYTIGATGCGYVFYDGVIHFSNELYKFEYKKDPNYKLLCDFTELDVKKFLDTEKYQPIIDNIYKGLGIPKELVNGS